jgi:hypothetical protein
MDKFSQALATQYNSRKRMQRMIQTELPLWKQIKILPTDMEEKAYCQQKN